MYYVQCKFRCYFGLSFSTYSLKNEDKKVLIQKLKCYDVTCNHVLISIMKPLKIPLILLPECDIILYKDHILPLCDVETFRGIWPVRFLFSFCDCR